MTWPLYIEPPVIAVAPQTVSAIEQARRDMFVATAEGAALTVCGQNYGVPRPPFLSDDEIYRRCVQVLAMQPKMILFTTYALLSAVFGSQQDLIDEGKRPWRIYEVIANEIIVEIPAALISANNETASYFHGWDGYALNAGAITDTFTTEGDVSTCMAIPLTGQDLYAYTGGAWNPYEIVNFSYDATTNLSTIQIDAVAIPTGGTYFYTLPPGDDGPTSYKGDYIAPSGHVVTFYTAAGVGLTDTVNVRGDFSGELYLGDTITLVFGGAQHTYTITNIPTYTPTTPGADGDFTQFTVSAVTVPLGLNNGVLIKAIEKADTPTTAGHADRVYFVGNGLYDIFDYYFNLLVRAAGVVLRFERI